jgi:hypothetical protein
MSPFRATCWPVPPLALIALGVIVLTAPARLEGPILLPISPGHAISRLDAIGLVPLLAGTLGLYAGLWRRRARVYQFAAEYPAPFTSAVFAAGLGLGLLIASAFSTFIWWWAAGAVLFGLVLVGAVLALARR